MIYFVVRYSRKRHPLPEDVKDNVPLEIIWTVIPTLLVLAMFYVGWKGFQYMRTAPPDAMLIKVTAREWSWTFNYANGRESAVLKVPVREPVKLLITSVDVLHSLYIPAFRIKEDAVPGRETHLWFLPDEVGSYDLFCTEYCGAGHSAMITKVEVMPAKDFIAWYESGSKAIGPSAQAAIGEMTTHHAADATLLKNKGCLACHSVDGSPKIGPTFKGLFGKKERVTRDGKEQEITVDEAFLRRKLLQPELERVKGFPPIMPSQKGLLTNKELDMVIEHLKTL
jgi:cytochrome c oxidase subunit 2